jgi:hypothetical protein
MSSGTGFHKVCHERWSSLGVHITWSATVKEEPKWRELNVLERACMGVHDSPYNSTKCQNHPKMRSQKNIWPQIVERYPGTGPDRLEQAAAVRKQRKETEEGEQSGNGAWAQTRVAGAKRPDTQDAEDESRQQR